MVFARLRCKLAARRAQDDVCAAVSVEMKFISGQSQPTRLKVGTCCIDSQINFHFPTQDQTLAYSCV